MFQRLTIATALLLCLAWTASAQDIVRLKRGGVMEGLIVEEDQATVTIRVAGGTISMKRNLIEEIVRSEDPEDDERRRVLSALTRFRPRTTHHFLYRDGRRVGFRTRSVKPDVESDRPGYLIEDRLAFMENPGPTATVDLVRREYVDAELAPRRYELRVSTGTSTRRLSGTFDESGILRISETENGRQRHRMTLLPGPVALPGALAIDLAREGAFEGNERRALTFEPETERFEMIRIEREQAYRIHRGEERSVRILRVHSSRGTLETWADREGLILREELGSPGLVSLRATPQEVANWTREEGEERGEDDLGLSLVFETHGLALRRPDLTWEVLPGSRDQRRIVSLTLPRYQATMDLFRLPARDGLTRPEEAVLKLIERLAARSEDHELVEMEPAEVAGHPGVRFVSRAGRRNAKILTRGAVFGRRGRYYAFLGSAPARRFDSGRPAFDEAIESLELLRGRPGEESTPFDGLEDESEPR